MMEYLPSRYYSCLEKLLREGGDLFDQIEEFDRDNLNLCPYCQERPSDLTGYASDPSCIGCSPLIVDESREIMHSQLWLLVQPCTRSEKYDLVFPNGSKRKWRFIDETQGDDKKPH